MKIDALIEKGRGQQPRPNTYERTGLRSAAFRMCPTVRRILGRSDRGYATFRERRLGECRPIRIGSVNSAGVGSPVLIPPSPSPCVVALSPRS